MDICGHWVESLYEANSDMCSYSMKSPREVVENRMI